MAIRQIVKEGDSVLTKKCRTVEKFDGKPVGLETLAATVNEDAGTIEDVYEPYLLQLGFIARTPRGRVILKGGYEHLGLKLTEKQKKQLSLFDKPQDD